MKLIIAIISDDDVREVTRTLNEEKIQFTKLATSGGFLKKGNSTLLIGCEDPNSVLKILKELCQEREELVTAPVDTITPIVFPVKVGGATVFILDVEQCIKL